MNYEAADKICGEFGCPIDWCTCFVRDGEDILVLFRTDETARWKPTNELIVTIPAMQRNYFMRETWNRRLLERTKCEAVSRTKNMAEGLYFGVRYNGLVYQIRTQLHINLNTEAARAIDPPIKRKILRKKAREAYAHAKAVMKASVAAHLLMPATPPNWEAARLLQSPKRLAKCLAEERVGEIATALSARHRRVNLEYAEVCVDRVRGEIYEEAGATV